MKNFLILIALFFSVQIASAQDDYKSNLQAYVDNILGLRTQGNTDRDSSLNSIANEDDKSFFISYYNQFLDLYITEIMGVYNQYYENTPDVFANAVLQQNSVLPQVSNSQEMNSYLQQFTQKFNNNIDGLKSKYVVNP